MIKSISVFGGAFLLSCAAFTHGALADGPETREYSRKGEHSPGTAAPSIGMLVQVIEHGSPEKLKATLEYGERVVCESCVPLLDAKLLESNDAQVRELSAWWLRRQPFAAPHVLRHMREVLKSDGDEQRRARAASALGELMDHNAFAALADAARVDTSGVVRASAVRGLARLNSDGAGAVLADSFSDADPQVRRATLSVLTSVGTFSDYAALLPLLADDEADIRTRAARLCGEQRIADAESVLVALLSQDESVSVRQAAAWALGRVGGSAGQSALTDASTAEDSPRVLDAVRVALRMKSR